MNIVPMFVILNNEKNRLWYPKLVGLTLNEAQFYEVPANFWIDYQRIEYKVRDVTND